LPKNILYIGNKLQRHGRTATTIDTLAPLLESAGFKVHCASHRVNKVSRFLDIITTVLRLKNWTHYVLIDTYSTQNFWYAITVSRLCRLFKIKYIPILHGGNLPRRLLTHKQLVTRYLDNAHAVVSPSDFLKSAFAKALHTPIQVIKNNIEIAQYPFSEREVVQPNLLWVRSFAAVYNPMMALDVLVVLLQNYPNAQLTMVGPDKDGSMETCRQRALKDKLPVTFTGLLTKTEWIALSMTHGVFINTSNVDNLPVSIIEAMALGLIVVSTQVGGISFLVSHGINGLLVPAANPDEMANAINHILTDQTLAQAVILNAFNTAAQHDWQVIKPQWVALLR